MKAADGESRLLPMLDDLDLTRIPDPAARAIIGRLLNVIEELATEIRTLRAENQRRRDEVNRLKGEQGKPSIIGNRRQRPAPPDHSSERERHEPTPRQKVAKRDHLPIHRTETRRLDRSQLPPDAQFKGYVPVIIQDLVFQANTICLQREKDYAPSTGQTSVAPLPPGYDGQFGPTLKALAITLAFGANVSELQIHTLFDHMGIEISAGELSNLLIKDQAAFHAEKAAVYRAGLASSPWQHIDATATRVNGQNEHCHIVGNPVHTAYFTTPAKDRLTVIAVLQDLASRTYRLTAEALRYLEQMGLAAGVRAQVATLARDEPLDAAAFDARLGRPSPKWGCTSGAGLKKLPWSPPLMPRRRFRWSICSSAMMRRSASG